jgi:hypothetical protein
MLSVMYELSIYVYIYMYIYTASFNNKNSAFCTHYIFICSVIIPKTNIDYFPVQH